MESNILAFFSNRILISYLFIEPVRCALNGYIASTLHGKFQSEIMLTLLLIDLCKDLFFVLLLAPILILILHSKILQFV